MALKTKNLDNYTRQDSELLGFSRIVEKKGVASSRYDIFDEDNISTRDNTFNRFNWIYPADELGNLLSYVFIVKPDLNIIKQASSAKLELTDTCSTDPFFNMLANTQPSILRNLSCSASTSMHHFINFLVDRVEGYQITDWGVGTNEISQPFTNYKFQYAGNANDSLSAREFSITFREDANLRITNLFTAWTRYINGVVMNRYETRKQYQQSRFINGSPIIDYATSIYLIKTKPDGSEIVYFHKVTGAFPTVVPHSNWSYNKDGKTETNIDIQFSGGFPEPMNPYTLAEFNRNSKINSAGLARAFAASSEFASWGQPIVGRPYIARDNTNHKLRLFWEPYGF